MQYIILVVMLLVASALLEMQSENQKTAEIEEMAYRISMIEKASESDNPTILAAGAKAEREIQEINDKEEARIKEEAYQATLEPFERPSTWALLIGVIVSMIAMPFIVRIFRRRQYT